MDSLATVDTRSPAQISRLSEPRMQTLPQRCIFGQSGPDRLGAPPSRSIYSLYTTLDEQKIVPEAQNARTDHTIMHVEGIEHDQVAVLVQWLSRRPAVASDVPDQKQLVEIFRVVYDAQQRRVQLEMLPEDAEYFVQQSQAGNIKLTCRIAEDRRAQGEKRSNQRH